MRIPSRLLLAGSVVGALIASSTTVIAMPKVAGASVDVPTFPEVRQPAAAAPPAALPVVPAPGPPVTGPQIVEHAVTPARDRANALAEEAKAAEQARAAAEAQARQAAPAPPPPKQRGSDRDRRRDGDDRDGRRGPRPGRPASFEVPSDSRDAWSRVVSEWIDRHGASARR